MRRWCVLIAATLALAGCTGQVCESMTDTLVVPAIY